MMPTPGKRAALLASSLVLLGLLGCSAEKREAGTAVARVGNSVITLKRYHDALKRLMPPGQSTDAGELTDLKRDLINQMVEEELIVQEAGRLKMKVSDSELKAEVDAEKREYGDEPFKDAITERYGSVEKWNDEIRRKLLVRKATESVVNSEVNVSEEAARKYYSAHPGDFSVEEEVRARMIVVATEDAARKIRGGLTQKGFAEAARKFSLSPEAKNGGDLGFFSRGGMPKEFEDVVFGMKPGEISPVVKTQYGYHIFSVEAKKKGGRLSYEDARGKIFDKLKGDAAQEVLNAWMTELKRNTRIEVKEDLL